MSQLYNSDTKKLVYSLKNYKEKSWKKSRGAKKKKKNEKILQVSIFNFKVQMVKHQLLRVLPSIALNPRSFLPHSSISLQVRSISSSTIKVKMDQFKFLTVILPFLHPTTLNLRSLSMHFADDSGKLHFWTLQDTPEWSVLLHPSFLCNGQLASSSSR